MPDVYEACPVLTTPHFTLRLVEKADAPALLAVYSDERAVPFFNGDNCHGDDFHYTTMERMDQAIDFWLYSYCQRYFVRWTILDEAQTPVGTVEIFRRVAQDAFTDCALLRLDLRCDMENCENLSELLAELTPRACELFDCAMVATKAREVASARREALRKQGYVLSDAPLVGEGGVEYLDYWAWKAK